MATDYAPTVLITGAKSGIGLEFGRQFAARGWKVIATHRSLRAPEPVAKAMGRFPSIGYEPLDVTDPAAIGALAGKLAEQPVDVLINNAGIAYDGSEGGIGRQSFGSCDPDTFHRMFGVNVLGALLVTQAFTDHLRKGRHRKVVSVSSTNGSLTAPLPGASIYYKASKAALNRAMICVAEALRPDGIAVAMLHPGAVRTEKNLEHGAGDYPGLIETPFSVEGMMGVIDRLTIENTGKFYNYDAGFAPW